MAQASQYQLFDIGWTRNPVYLAPDVLVTRAAGFGHVSLDLIYGLTSGGPGVATQVLALRVFEEGLRFFNYGFASAISVVLLGLVAVIGMIGIFLFRRFEVTY